MNSDGPGNFWHGLAMLGWVAGALVLIALTLAIAVELAWQGALAGLVAAAVIGTAHVCGVPLRRRR